MNYEDQKHSYPEVGTGVDTDNRYLRSPSRNSTLFETEVPFPLRPPESIKSMSVSSSRGKKVNIWTSSEVSKTRKTLKRRVLWNEEWLNSLNRRKKQDILTNSERSVDSRGV